MVASSSVLATLALSLALLCHQGNRLHVLLLLIVLPATIAAILLPFITSPLHQSLWLISFLQGVLVAPLVSLAPLTRLKTMPQTWATTAQELGANQRARLRLLWLPLLRAPVAVGFFIALLCSLLGTVVLLKTSLP